MEKKFALTTHEKKYKVQQTDAGGGGVSCSDPQGEKIYCLVSEMKTKFAEKEPPSPPCIEWSAKTNLNYFRSS